MKTVSVEIKIPDGHEVESVSMIWPEYELFADKAYGQMQVYTKPAKPFLINGVPSDWPEWLTCDWIAKDANSMAGGYDGDMPTKSHSKYEQCWKCDPVAGRWGYIFGIAIDIPGPWEQSLRENPNRKK
jgi:hypothetical protein